MESVSLDGMTLTPLADALRSAAEALREPRAAVPLVLRDLCWAKDLSRVRYYLFLHRACVLLRPKVVVELGTEDGISARFLAAGTEAGHVWTIDAQTERGKWLTQGVPNLTALEGLFSMWAKSWSPCPDGGHDGEECEICENGWVAFGHPIDLLFVDGTHTADAVREDLTAWLPHVRPGGLVLFDDVNFPGVEEAIRAVLPDLETADWLHMQSMKTGLLYNQMMEEFEAAKWDRHAGFGWAWKP